MGLWKDKMMIEKNPEMIQKKKTHNLKTNSNLKY